MVEQTQAGQHWDTNLYDREHSYVWKFGEGVLELLEPRPGERILDLGAGTGHLAAKIAESGASVLGLDASPDMVEQARELYPDVEFVHADASDFRFDEPFDGVFSNATLHWVKRYEEAVVSIARALKPGGRFVAEFGGRGNVESAVKAVAAARESLGIPALAAEQYPWYFPGVPEYSALLEKHGFEVNLAQLFDRPTPQADGEAGLRSWLTMYASGIMAGVPDERRDELMAVVEKLMQPTQYHDGTWYVDYRRLRIIAIKQR